MIPRDLVIERGAGGDQRDLPIPEWQGLVPAEAYNSSRSLGQLTILSLSGYVISHGFQYWRQHTRFSILQSLAVTMTLDLDAALTMVNMAQNGEFASLDSLALNLQTGSTGAQPPMDAVISDLLSALYPLTQLSLQGYIYSKSFYTALQTHGHFLHSYTFTTKPDTRPFENPFAPTLLHITDPSPSCSHLTHLALRITRTHGDANEACIHRALGKVAYVQHLTLTVAIGTHGAHVPSSQRHLATLHEAHPAFSLLPTLR